MSGAAKKANGRRVEAEPNGAYQSLVGGIAGVIDAARRNAVRSVNAAMTAAYWLIGRHIVEFEQGGRERADYGAALLRRLASDLTQRFGRGFSRLNLQQMRLFYLAYPPHKICQTPSGKFEPLARPPILQTPSSKSQPPAPLPIGQTPSGKLEARQVDHQDLVAAFPLPWSAYVRLLSVKNPNARTFYEAEALRGGWSVRQLDRQISSQFYERTALSKNKAQMLKNGEQALLADAMPPEQALKDPFVLEFLNLKDEYSESDLEDALIHRLESFLMEPSAGEREGAPLACGKLGGDFCFIGRQRRLRIDDEWYRVDLVFFHRVLRCLVLIDLKAGKFTHADAGQMHLYLNYAREHWVHEHENPPVGLILCAEKGKSLARYALEGLPNKVMAAEYRTALPDERVLVAAIERARSEIDTRNGHLASTRLGEDGHGS